jgi:hypothetical protein
MSSRQILDLRQQMDARAGGKLPVIAETPSVGLVIPRVAPDGALRSVAFINARIDVQPPLTLRLRGVTPDKASATWHALRAASVTVPLVRADGETRTTLPPLAAWNCGWLEL